MTPVPDVAYAAALAGLDLLTASRLSRLLGATASAEEAWAVVASGRSADVLVLRSPRRRPQEIAGRLAHDAGRTDVAALWQRCRRLGLRVLRLGDAAYPPVLAADHAPPAVLFALGDLGVLGAPRVAIVGTRRATANGRAVAHGLGAGLAEAGVCVVSGLARGIDGQAHRGALSAHGAAPAGVVGCGLDVVYPAEHHDLWHRVAAAGVLLAEVPPGTPPRPHRFPSRNRILAALADAVVVVESRRRGGSLVTANEAIERGVRVLAVPGSPLSPASEGTNALIADGCPPARDATDVLVALGLSALDLREQPRAQGRPDPLEQRVVDCFGGEPLDLESLVRATGESLAAVAMAVGRLEAEGRLTQTAGWFERVVGPRRRVLDR